MAALKYSGPSLKDLEEIKKYITDDSPLYAKRFVKNIRLKISLLKKYPEISRPVYPERFKNLRQILFNAYRIAYLYAGDVVTVITVHRQSKLLENVQQIKDYKE